MTFSKEVPTHAQIKEVLDFCGASVTSVAAAAMHLATPTDAAVGSDIWRSQGMWTFRGETAPIVHDSVDAAIEAALQMARNTQRPDDLFLDLDAGPTSWVKIISSGTSKVAFGLSVLTGETLIADKHVTDETVAQAAGLVLSGAPVNTVQGLEDAGDDEVEVLAERSGIAPEMAADILDMFTDYNVS